VFFIEMCANYQKSDTDIYYFFWQPNEKQ